MGKFRDPQRKVERVVFSGTGRTQHPPFFEVHTRGHSVEWTDRRSEAHAAFNQVDSPKELTMVSSLGVRTLLERK